MIRLIRPEANGIPLQKLEILPLRRQAYGAGNYRGVANAAGEGGTGGVLCADIQVQKAAHHVAGVIIGKAGTQNGSAAVQMPGAGILNPGQNGTVFRRFLWRFFRFRFMGHDSLAGYGFEQIVLHGCASPPFSLIGITCSILPVLSKFVKEVPGGERLILETNKGSRA